MLRILLLIISLQTNFISVTCKKPNILLIVADDYGWNDIGYHSSNTDIRTPTLDKLAAEGVKLENYYVQPICTPSRSQLLSGRYQIHTGLQHSTIDPPNRPSGLTLSVSTLPDELRKLGYSTHMVGKWHLGFFKREYTPTNRGFDSFFGFLGGSEDYYTHETFHALDLRDNEKLANYTGVYSTELFASRVQDVLREHVDNKEDKPLFMYVPFQACHSPLEVPDNYEREFSFMKNKNRRIYAGMVSAMDQAVANITSAYEKYGLWDNTIFIFSTDNGGPTYVGANNWPLRAGKHSLFEGGIRGVGFVRGSLVSKPNRVERGLVHISDWYPTLINIAGGNIKKAKLDGFDVWSTISTGAESPRKEILHNIDPLAHPKGEHLVNSTFDIRVRSAIRQGKWKLITGDPSDKAQTSGWVPPPTSEKQDAIPDPDPPNKNIWLFDIVTDPLEMQEVSELYPQVVDSLLKRLAYYNSTAVPCLFPPPDPKGDPKLHGGVWGPWRD